MATWFVWKFLIFFVKAYIEIYLCSSPFDTFKSRRPALFENSRDTIPTLLPPPPRGNMSHPSNGYLYVAQSTYIEVRTDTYCVRMYGTVYCAIKELWNLYCEERRGMRTLNIYQGQESQPIRA